MKDVFEELCRVVTGLDVALIPRELKVPNAYPRVDWDDDQQGFINAARQLHPSAVYAALSPLGEDDVCWLVEEYGVEEDQDRAPKAGRELLREARQHFREPFGIAAGFLHDGVAHVLKLAAPWWVDLARRMQEFAAAEDTEYTEGLKAMYERVENNLLPRLRTLFLSNEEYITLQPMSARHTYEDRILQREFTPEEVKIIENNRCMLQILAEWRGIVQIRRQAAEASFDKWATELSRSPEFQAAKSQALRRKIAKDFLRGKEPLVVSGDKTVSLELAAVKRLRGH